MISSDLLFSVPGSRGGHSYLYSHMLAVKAEHRNAGLGRRLKLFQREDALARNFELMEWTFDPLEIKNAYLNLEKLGAIARRYNVNQYGITLVATARRAAHRPIGGRVVAEIKTSAASSGWWAQTGTSDQGEHRGPGADL